MLGICPSCYRRVRMLRGSLLRHLVFLGENGRRCEGSKGRPFAEEQDPRRLVKACDGCPSPVACAEEGACIVRLARAPGVMRGRATVVR